jgi:hypothetical protein
VGRGLWRSGRRHRAARPAAGGGKLFVDYAGATVPVIIDRLTGETRTAQIFVAVMGASNFTYPEASWTQALADWIGAHTPAFAAIGGVPNLLVPDNTKVAVIKACLYEPQVNRRGPSRTPELRASDAAHPIEHVLFFRFDIKAGGWSVAFQLEQTDRHLEPVREDGGPACFDVAVC